MVRAMSDQQAEWSAVGAAIDQRMKDLGLTTAEVIRASGVSFKSLKGYIAGKPIKRRDKARTLAAALGWPGDAFDRILAGETPEPPSARKPLEPLDEDGVDDEVVESIRRSSKITADQRDLLIVAYRGAVARTAHGRSGQVDGEQHDLA
jgi:transcriptional regulator with XRE-family HTH domain